MKKHPRESAQVALIAQSELEHCHEVTGYEEVFQDTVQFIGDNFYITLSGTECNGLPEVPT